VCFAAAFKSRYSMLPTRMCESCRRSYSWFRRWKRNWIYGTAHVCDHTCGLVYLYCLYRLISVIVFTLYLLNRKWLQITCTL